MTRTLAIIGAGPAAVSVLAGMALEAMRHDNAYHTIILYAPGGTIGPGLAYGAHNPPSFICNHEIVAMGSAFPGASDGTLVSFAQWCFTHHKRLHALYPDTDFTNDQDYAPRSCYGLYLKESYDAAFSILKSSGIVITVKTCFVEDVLPDTGGITLQDKDGATTVDAALLATGVAFKEDPFMIPAYDADRWQRHSPAGGKGAAVIIGSGLSAYEAALRCVEGGFYEKVTMISRSGVLRRVRCPYTPYKPRFFTRERLNFLAGGPEAPLRFHDILLCLAQEINVLYGQSSPFYEREQQPEAVLDDMMSRSAEHIVRSFLHDCDHMHSKGLWRGLRQAIDDAFRAEIFRRLDAQDMHIFRRYMSLYESFNSPMSLVSASRLAEHFRNGSIILQKGTPDVSILPAGGYSVSCGTEILRCDTVINATGFSRNITETPLYSHMLQRKHAALHANGGILIHPEYCNVCRPDGTIYHRLFALGHMHQGALLISATPHLTRTGAALGRRLYRFLPSEKVMAGTRA